MSNVKCTLEKDINKCPHYNPDNGSCEAEKPCSFARNPEDHSVGKSEYIRKERWYEKYYK